MISEWITAISTALLVLATGALAFVGYKQLNTLNKQLVINLNNEKIRNTLNACQRIENDPTLMNSQEKIFNKSENGKDYTKLDDTYKFDMIILLNYFDGIATGVLKGIYDEDMVREALDTNIKKAVLVFIKGESRVGWKADKVYFDPEQFASLMKLYYKWSDFHFE